MCYVNTFNGKDVGEILKKIFFESFKFQSLKLIAGGSGK